MIHSIETYNLNQDSVPSGKNNTRWFPSSNPEVFCSSSKGASTKPRPTTNVATLKKVKWQWVKNPGT